MVGLLSQRLCPDTVRNVAAELGDRQFDELGVNLVPNEGQYLSGDIAAQATQVVRGIDAVAVWNDSIIYRDLAWFYLESTQIVTNYDKVRCL